MDIRISRRRVDRVFDLSVYSHWRIAWMATIAALTLLAPAPTTADEPQLPDSLKKLFSAPASNTSKTKALPATAQPATAQAEKTRPKASRQKVAPLSTRPHAAIAKLFAQGTVSGADLLAELMAIKKALHAQRSQAAVAKFMGSLDESMGGGAKKDGFKFPNLLAKHAVNAFESLVKEQVTTVGYKTLDDYLASLIDDPTLLSREQITLPSAQGMSREQMQRTVTMAALVVASRVSNKILAKAKEDFAGIEAGYAKLLDRREQAATLLYQAIADQGNGNTSNDTALAAAIPGDRLAPLKARIASMSLKEFSNDFEAQNHALEFLRAKDPATFAEYRAQADETLRGTNAYVRTVSGVAAFGGLIIQFGQEVTEAAETKDSNSMLQVLPFALEFVKETPLLVKLSFETSTQGVFVQPAKALNAKRFRVAKGEQTRELSRAKDVFAELKKQNVEPLLVDAFFRSDSPGLLYKLYQCDRIEAGRMIDAATPAAGRDTFAQNYLQSTVGGFSFANSFESPGVNTREKELGYQLLRRDHRTLTDDPTKSLSAVQTDITVKYSEWGDQQLMRLIFSNREGSAAAAALQLSEVTIRPVPTMQSVYAYESLVDGCRQLVDAAPATEKQKGGGKSGKKKIAKTTD